MKLILSAMLLVATACAPLAASPSASPTATSTAAAASTIAAATTTPATATTVPVSGGTITGKFGYPAEGHPAVTIYAVNRSDRSVYYTVHLDKSAESFVTYTITGIRPGTYNAFAKADGSASFGGAYTAYVACGLRAQCTDHTLIDVTVRAGETTSGVDVTDWYATPGTFGDAPR